MQGEAQNLPTALNTKKDMFHLDDKISFTGGFLLTMATSISMVGILQAALVGLAGGFFGLLGKELYYYSRKKLTSAKFKVQIIGLYDKLKKWW